LTLAAAFSSLLLARAARVSLPLGHKRRSTEI
jgi:hypothetical protein